jgi:6-pyruvoyltetrahydropterin/6-carboxytetrahydropterin synthase
MYEITVVTKFAAAHAIREIGGNCENLHGHNWRIEVALAATDLNQIGLVIDFREVKQALGRVMDQLDHKYLNDIEFFAENSPTSENIARYIFEGLTKNLGRDDVRVVKVTAWESDTAAASYLGPNH